MALEAGFLSLLTDASPTRVYSSRLIWSSFLSSLSPLQGGLPPHKEIYESGVDLLDVTQDLNYDIHRPNPNKFHR